MSAPHPLARISAELHGMEADTQTMERVITVSPRPLNDALECSRILRERDDALRYEQEYGADAYGGPRVLSCGCHAGFDCDWHNYVQEFMDALPDEPVEENFPCVFEDWSKR